MNSIKNDVPSFASYDNLIEEAKLLTEFFIVFSVSQVKRKKNSVAHNFVKYTRHISNLSMWIKSNLSHLNVVTFADLVI